MRSSPSPAALAACIAALSALGCVQPKHPKLTVTDATFTGIDLQVRPLSLQVHLELLVRADNPNGFDLKVERVSGTTTIAGKHELPVDLAPDRWLAANQSSTFTVPITVPAEMIPALAGEALSRSCIPYKFEGRADLVATSTFELEKKDYPLKKEGCLDRERLLGVIKK